MTNAEAVEILKRLQDPEPREPQITSAAYNALNMAISALEKQEWKKTLTNADRIRAMSDEELAYALRCLPEQLPPDGETCSTYNCYLCTINWLKQEVKDNA